MLAIILVFILPVKIFGLIQIPNACKSYSDYPFRTSSEYCFYNPNVDLDPPSMIINNGYEFEGHSVTTNDGYILSLYHIPPAENKNKKQTIFIQHGMITNSAIWVNRGGNQSLAFYLSNLGYDVWLGNLRGSTYSTKHSDFDINDEKYWDFTLDDLAKYDIREMLLFIAKKMKRKVIYIGHSLGTTVGLMYGSLFDESNLIVKGMVLLSPVVYISSPFVQQLVDYAPLIEGLFNVNNISGILYNEKTIHPLSHVVCSNHPQICLTILGNLAGKLSEQFLPEDLLLYFSSWPSGGSVKQIKQYEQIAKSDTFQMFDYENENFKIYGQNKPPVYNLKKIQFPVALFYGLNDNVVSQTDAIRAFESIGSSKKIIEKIPKDISEEYGNYNHIDFLYAKDNEKLLYEEIVRFIENL